METENAVIDIISEKFSIKKEKISAATTMREIGADSLDVVDVVAELEQKFAIRVSDDEIDAIRTVADMAECVSRHL